jgi:hypothetical protein
LLHLRRSFPAGWRFSAKAPALAWHRNFPSDGRIANPHLAPYPIRSEATNRRRENVLSRAFVKESEGLVESLPDRQISPHPNLVTPEGLALIDATIGRLRNERSAVFGADDHASLARIERELRYWLARLDGAGGSRADVRCGALPLPSHACPR